MLRLPSPRRGNALRDLALFVATLSTPIVAQAPLFGDVHNTLPPDNTPGGSVLKAPFESAQSRP